MEYKKEAVPKIPNLIGMYALLVKDNEISITIKIIGKADDNYFICQYSSAIDGSLNIARLMSIEELKTWIIVPTADIVNELYTDYYKNGWRYGFSL